MSSSLFFYGFDTLNLKTTFKSELNKLNQTTILDLKKLIEENHEINKENITVKLRNSKSNISLENHCLVKENDYFEIGLKLLGGKGGFGSLLKGQPAVKKRTKNFDSCRDLSGRRLRHVKQEEERQKRQIKQKEEEELLNEYLNPTSNKVSDIPNTKLLEIERKAESLEKENKNAANSVVHAMKFLKKKKMKQAKIKNETEKKKEKLNKENENKTILNSNLSLNLKEDKEEVDITKLEEELFSDLL